MRYDEPIQQDPQENPPQQAEQETQREWVEPTFERLTLKEAMSGISIPSPFDFTTNYS